MLHGVRRTDHTRAPGVPVHACVGKEQIMGESAVLTEQDVEVVEEELEFSVEDAPAESENVTASDGVAPVDAAPVAVAGDAAPVAGVNGDVLAPVAPQDAGVEVDRAMDDTTASIPVQPAEAEEAITPAVKPVQAGLRPGLRTGLSR